jgi:hypothetical protein
MRQNLIPWSIFERKHTALLCEKTCRLREHHRIGFRIDIPEIRISSVGRFWTLMSHWSTLTCLNENDEQSDFVRTKNEVKVLSKFVFNDSEYNTTPLRVKPEFLVNRKELDALSDASNLKIEIYCRRNLRNNFRYYTLNEELPVLSSVQLLWKDIPQ